MELPRWINQNSDVPSDGFSVPRLVVDDVPLLLVRESAPPVPATHSHLIRYLIIFPLVVENMPAVIAGIPDDLRTAMVVLHKQLYCRSTLINTVHTLIFPDQFSPGFPPQLHV